MMSLSIYVYLCTLTFVFSPSKADQCGDCGTAEKWGEDLSIAIPVPTHAPVNFNPKRARLVKPETPLHLTCKHDAVVKVQNNGKTLTVLRDTEDPSEYYAEITGGILRNEVYVFESVVFYWNLDPSKPCCSNLGYFPNGPPLAFRVFFYKKSYGSFENAKDKRDGLVAFTGGSWVSGVVDNPDFESFAEVIRKLESPGIQCTSLSNVLQTWFLRYNNTLSQYVYPGAYISPEECTEYNSTIVILPVDNTEPTLSIYQFQSTFANLKSDCKIALNTMLPSYPEYECFQLVQTDNVFTCGIV